MMKTRRVAVLILLITVIVSTVPASAMLYTQAQSRENNPAEKFVELADRARQRVEDLINLMYANETAIKAIEEAGLLDELEGNVTLFNEGVENVTNAYKALEIGDYEEAIANTTYALRIFREVFRSIHIILKDSELQKGQLIDAQGLLEAMRRALERIERLREILSEDATEAIELLDTAEDYLDIDAARIWLLEGKVNQTAHNLTQANRLIARAYQYLKNQAKKMNAMRIKNYLRRAEQTRKRIMEKLEFASKKGINATVLLESLGYQNATEFRQVLQSLIEDAQGKMKDIKNAIHDLKAIGQTIRKMEQALTKQMEHHREGNGNGQGSNGNGHDQGNGGNSHGQGNANDKGKGNSSNKGKP